jgi:hypothetical protein
LPTKRLGYTPGDRQNRRKAWGFEGGGGLWAALLKAALRKLRSVEIETVIGLIKGNQGYCRLLLRGMAKVFTEWGWLPLGYNLKQMYRLSRDKTA